MRLGACFLLLGLGGAACVELPDFPSAQEVAGPRLLALVAEPPEAGPGQQVQLSLLVAEADVLEVSWRLCPGFYTFSGMQYQDAPTVEGCSGSVDFPLPDGLQSVVDVSPVVEQLLTDEAWQTEVLGGLELSEDALALILAEVGFPVVIEARARIADGRILVGIKRLLLSFRYGQNTNPDQPAFVFSTRTGLDVGMTYQGSFECAGSDGGPLRLPAGETVEVAPDLRPNMTEESWLEYYNVIDPRGALLEGRKERAHYAFYSTNNGFAEDETLSPLRNNQYTVATAGCHRLWFIVQDGHGGLSACGVDVEPVGASTPDPVDCVGR